MSEKIENDIINFWKRNKNISMIVFDHVLYKATITLTDNSVKVINLNDNSNENNLNSVGNENNQVKLYINCKNKLILVY
jgi:hypothetical protein